MADFGEKRVGNMPLGGVAPPIKCGRLLRWPDESTRCPNDATWHVIWTPEIDNTIDCDRHKAEAEQHPHLAIHPYRMECSMPGAVFVHDENVCIVDEELLGLPTAQERFAHSVMDRLAESQSGGPEGGS